MRAGWAKCRTVADVSCLIDVCVSAKHLVEPLCGDWHLSIQRVCLQLSQNHKLYPSVEATTDISAKGVVRSQLE